MEKLYFDQKNGLYYTLEKNGISLVRYDDSVEDFNIPNDIEGYKVIRIEDSCFEGCLTINNIDFPEELEFLGNGSFKSCFNLKRVNINNNLHSILENTFDNCLSLETLYLPETITEFKSDLKSCISLKSIDFSGGVKSYISEMRLPKLKSVKFNSGTEILGKSIFEDCTSLESVEFPKTIKVIGKHAFSNCLMLTNVNFPDSLIEIGESAFLNCQSLTSIDLPPNIETVSPESFQGCIKVEKIFWRGVFRKVDTWPTTHIHHNSSGHSQTVLRGFESLRELVFGDNIEELNFSNFPTSNLEFVKLPRYLKSIKQTKLLDLVLKQSNEEYLILFGDILARYNGSGLKFTIPDSVNGLLEGCFASSKIVEIEFNSNITKIPDNCFANCANLTSVKIPSHVTEIGGSSFYHCDSLKDIEFDNGLSIIGDYAFANCSRLENIKFPRSLKKIDDRAFSECNNLKNVVFNEGLFSLGNLAFYGCSELNDLVLPNSLTSIGDGCFRNCSNLDIIKFSEGLESIGSYAFNDIKGFKEVNLPLSLTKIGREIFNQEISYLKFPPMISPEKYDNGNVYYGSLGFTRINILEYSNSKQQINEFFDLAKVNKLLLKNDSIETEIDLQHIILDEELKPHFLRKLSYFKSGFRFNLLELFTRDYYRELNSKLRKTIFKEFLLDENTKPYIGLVKNFDDFNSMNFMKEFITNRTSSDIENLIRNEYFDTYLFMNLDPLIEKALDQKDASVIAYLNKKAMEYRDKEDKQNSLDLNL